MGESFVIVIPPTTTREPVKGSPGHMHTSPQTVPCALILLVGHVTNWGGTALDIPNTVPGYLGRGGGDDDLSP